MTALPHTTALGQLLHARDEDGEPIPRRRWLLQKMGWEVDDGDLSASRAIFDKSTVKHNFRIAWVLDLSSFQIGPGWLFESYPQRPGSFGTRRYHEVHFMFGMLGIHFSHVEWNR